MEAILKEIKTAVENGRQANIDNLVERALKGGTEPEQVIATMVAAIREVGERTVIR